MLGIYSGTTPVVLFETYGGDITYREGKNNRVIVDNYAPNKAYSFKVDVDLFNQESHVYVDNEYIGFCVSFTKTDI